MAKKKRVIEPRRPKQDSGEITLSDQLGNDLLEKLKAAKKELVAEEQRKEEERQAAKLREKKEREKNKTFEELLEEYGDIGSKY